ncbi:MAG: hypothetical protein H0V17_23170 [Deltaproteobacteria bacterium]|nr:hypothetical protein [Deltaproteobacteria bacterium]
MNALRPWRVELVGEPVRRASSYLRGFSTAQIRITPFRPLGLVESSDR